MATLTIVVSRIVMTAPQTTTAAASSTGRPRSRIGPSLGGEVTTRTRRRTGSEAQGRLQQAVDLATVGAALGLAHDGADEGAHRFRVAALDALHHVRVLRDHP